MDEKKLRALAAELAKGINTEGQKELLGMWLAENEGGEILAQCADRAERSGSSGHPDCLRGRPERLP